MIGRFDTIFWDVDGTLLVFAASEEISLQRCLARQGAAATPGQIALYRTINHDYWSRLERGEVTREQLYPGRFSDWFAQIGLRGVDPVRMNEDYQVSLGECPVLQPGALEVLRILADGGCRQYVVTNGSTVAQEGKLARSGIGAQMDGVFISEQLGVPKPERRFFELCAARIPDYRRERTVIIGDSLSSDMAGGNRAGIACVWFNPRGELLRGDVRIDAAVKTLYEIPALLATL
jgi:2-haloacid dehalogenase